VFGGLNMQKPLVSFDELMMALEFVSAGDLGDHAAYVSRQTGAIYWESEYGNEQEELPDDIGDPKQYVAVPNKYDLDLGKALVERFARKRMPKLYDEVMRCFRRKGAYSIYKDLLERAGRLEEWYKFEEEEKRAALIAWCQDEGLELAGDGEDQVVAPPAN